ncbi:thymidine phosphorylase [Lichenihabitans sp. Uapishka_5]|uniref:thymidine phosphorylase n=1 Tax=Lichenihabitans sp. Uapishka_5 TaxID=3037302 RepID=UPI0029E7E0E9|nr:thymidine phosphorylase [Lichenihabitans sp. Uapishka_5]MDX7953093.1 thymidine phosphorylase [Lichenihabitans sp. Uapishka_5]
MPEGQAPVLPQEAIRRKRDGMALDANTIATFVEAAVTGRASGEQVAAFLMAAFLRGLDRDETVALTQAMTRSGLRLAWPDLHGPVLDKHSTGGVGDAVSLILAPAIAACGGYVPMISGRGLGHTGGTLDKLEAIPGYDTRPALPRLRAVVREVGCAIVGQTADLAPADRIFYAVRDVTATVESIPLITASILSKKLAAGLDALVMDVKTGNGAFMQGRAEAITLARSIGGVARDAGLPTGAFVTDMDQPLMRAAGNALELRQAVDLLAGRTHEPRLMAVVVALGAAMLRLGGLVDSHEAGAARLVAALSSGQAAECFDRMVAALGGPSDIVARAAVLLPAAPVVRPVLATRAGVVGRIDTRAVGFAVVALGGGRTRPDDAVDPRVGFTGLLPVGAPVEAGTPLGFVHAATDAAAVGGTAALTAAYRVADTAAPTPDPILEQFDVTA